MRAGDLIQDRFRLQLEVAIGGMGRVFRATDTTDGSPAAIKVMLRSDAESVARFKRECSVLARLRHPGVVRYLAHGATLQGDPWLATEWLEGEDLHRRLSRSPTPTRARLDAPTHHPGLPAETRVQTPSESEPPRHSAPGRLRASDVVTLLRRMATALATVHAEGLIHRDVKPSNIFLVDGELAGAKLLDLGAARPTLGASGLTRTGYMIGTPTYMAPEQLAAADHLTPAVDIWALGCVAYECLSGAPPFGTDNQRGFVGRVVRGRVERLVPSEVDAPELLLALVERMLHRDPAERPRDGAALVSALAAIETFITPSPSLAPVPSLGAAEQRVGCAVLVDPRGHARDARRFVPLLDAASLHAETHHGLWVVRMPTSDTITDQAHRAARFVTQLRETLPRWAFALAIEPYALGATPGLSDAARQLLASATGARVALDARTAALLESRFDVASTDDAHHLVQPKSGETTRTLLGRPTRTVGRRRELDILAANWAACVDDPRARALLVTAPAGLGKSRLRWEFHASLQRRGEPHRLLACHGDAINAGSPFALLAPALRHAAQIAEGESAADGRAKLAELVARTIPHARERQRVVVFLGELVGVHFDEDADEALRAARRDPMLLAGQIESAFVTWLTAEAAVQPMLIVVEDLHWGDRPSIALLDAALRTLQNAPLFVLALARPEVHDIFPALWSAHALDELRLEPLSRKSSVELAREVLGPDTPDDVLTPLVERAGGNAFYLEEMLRALATGTARGADALPDTVIGMVQSRLDAMGPEARRILRAASVFGEVFWEGGVRHLVGEAAGGYPLSDWLDDLCRREVITRSAGQRFPEENEYRFRHALVRDGAYALLTHDDRAKAHRLVGQWLELGGEHDAHLLATHYELGDAHAEAARWHARAAEVALDANDLESAVHATERARACGASGPLLGTLHALLASARYWQSRYRESAEASSVALTLCESDSPAWFQAAGTGLVAHARLGDFASFDALFHTLGVTQASPAAASAQLVGLCRGTFQRIFQTRFADADAVLARIDALVTRAPALDALTEAQIRHVRGVRAAMVGDVGHFLQHLEAAVAAFERAGDVRNVSLERTTVGWCHVELGRVESGVALLRDNLTHCRALRAQQAVTYAKVNLGYALERSPHRAAEAETTLREAIDETAAVKNARLEGWARGHLASLLLREGKRAEALLEAQRACALLTASPSLFGWVRALEARALLRLGRHTDALATARDALERLDALGGLLQGSALPPLVWAEALTATGEHQSAGDAAADARARLQRRAEALPDPAWRASFLNVEESLATLRLAPSEPARTG